MKRTARRTAAGLVLGSALLIGTPAVAMADDYPPTTPSPTVSGVVASTGSQAPVVASTSDAALPRTGTDVAVWLAAGTGLVAAGSALMVATRRKGARV